MQVMKEQLEIIKKCQELDVQIYSLKEEADQIPEQIAEFDRRFESEKADLQKLEAHLKETKLQLKQREASLKDKEDQITKYNGQLAQVKTNKEYASLQGEINGLKKETSDLEEQIINILDEIGGMEGEINKEKARLDEKKKELDQERSVLEAKKKADLAKIEELKAQKKTTQEPLDPEICRNYERIVIVRRGNALAKIDGENCSACSMQVRPQVINDVLLGEKIIQCENCSRILFSE